MKRNEIDDALPDPPPGLFWNLSENSDNRVVLSLRRKGFLGFSVTVEQALVINYFGYGATITELGKKEIQAAAEKCLLFLENRGETIRGRDTLLGNYKNRV